MIEYSIGASAPAYPGQPADEEAVLAGQLRDGQPAAIDAAALRTGVTYVAQAEASVQYAAASVPFLFDASLREVVIHLQRRSCEVRLIVQMELSVTAPTHWAAGLPLPALFDVRVEHAASGCVVEDFAVCECADTQFTCALGAAPERRLLQGEAYRLYIGCGVSAQVHAATRELDRAFEAGIMAGFSFGEDDSISDGLDDHLLSANWEAIDTVAQLLLRFPAVMMEIRVAAADVGAAERRAGSAVRALLYRSVPPERLSFTASAATDGAADGVSFVPHVRTEVAGESVEGALGVVPLEGEFVAETVDIGRESPQEVRALLRCRTSDVVVRLHNAVFDARLWGSALHVANGVPLRVEHVGTGQLVDEAVLTDGQARLRGREAALFVGERYRLLTPDTRCTVRAEVEFDVAPVLEQVVMVGVHRPMRAIAIVLAAMSGAPPLPAGIPFQLLHRVRTDDALDAARAELRTYLEEAAVLFRGAGEAGLPSPELAWSVSAHPHEAVVARNGALLDGIAERLARAPLLMIEVHGEAGDALEAPPHLAEWLQLDAVGDVHAIMEQLAVLRARACREALVRRGIAAERIVETTRGHGRRVEGDSAVRFDPCSFAPYVPSLYRAEDAPAPIGDGVLQLVYSGVTTEEGHEVLCRLPSGSGLYVDEAYELHVPSLSTCQPAADVNSDPPPDVDGSALAPGTFEPTGSARRFVAASTAFCVASDAPPDAEAIVRIELSGVPGWATVLFSSPPEESEWLASLPPLRFAVRHLASRAVVTAGTMSPPRAVLDDVALCHGDEYALELAHPAIEPLAPATFVAGAATVIAISLRPTLSATSAAAAAAVDSSRWYDDVQPVTAERESALRDARALVAVLGSGLGLEQIRARERHEAVAHIFGGHSAAGLQLLRQCHHQLCGVELGEALGAPSADAEPQAAKFEQLLVRPPAFFDLQLVRSSLRSAGGGTSSLPLLEALCTSLPTSIGELAAAFRQEVGSDLLSELQAAGVRGRDSALPLLCALLRGAPDAHFSSTPEQVAPDAAALHALLARSGSAAARDVQQAVALLGGRTRAHVRAVGARFAEAHGGSLRAALSARFGGDLLRAMVLLVEPAEVHYARKLHAAFFGLRATPELSEKKLNTGGAAHAETVAWTVASRHGRDLSGIKHAFETLYGKSLLGTIEQQVTHGALCTLLCAVVAKCPQGFAGVFS